MARVAAVPAGRAPAAASTRDVAASNGCAGAADGGAKVSRELERARAKRLKKKEGKKARHARTRARMQATQGHLGAVGRTASAAVSPFPPGNPRVP